MHLREENRNRGRDTVSGNQINNNANNKYGMDIDTNTNTASKSTSSAGGGATTGAGGGGIEIGNHSFVRIPSQTFFNESLSLIGDMCGTDNIDNTDNNDYNTQSPHSHLGASRNISRDQSPSQGASRGASRPQSPPINVQLPQINSGLSFTDSMADGDEVMEYRHYNGNDINPSNLSCRISLDSLDVDVHDTQLPYSCTHINANASASVEVLDLQKAIGETNMIDNIDMIENNNDNDHQVKMTGSVSIDELDEHSSMSVTKPPSPRPPQSIDRAIDRAPTTSITLLSIDVNSIGSQNKGQE